MPVPGWPGLAAYPGSVLTTTIFDQWPPTALPDFVTELATSTPMYVGTALGGAELFPGSVANELPHVVAATP